MDILVYGHFPYENICLLQENTVRRGSIHRRSVWMLKMLRGGIMYADATHAVVGPKEEFFNHAFGSTYQEFEELIYARAIYY